MPSSFQVHLRHSSDYPRHRIRNIISVLEGYQLPYQVLYANGAAESSIEVTPMHSGAEAGRVVVLPKSTWRLGGF